MLSHTSTEWAPWYVIPADRKWFARIGAGAVLVNALMELDRTIPGRHQGAARGSYRGQGGARGAGARGRTPGSVRARTRGYDGRRERRPERARGGQLRSRLRLTRRHPSRVGADEHRNATKYRSRRPRRQLVRRLRGRGGNAPRRRAVRRAPQSEGGRAARAAWSERASRGGRRCRAGGASSSSTAATCR